MRTRLVICPGLPFIYRDEQALCDYMNAPIVYCFLVHIVLVSLMVLLLMVSRSVSQNKDNQANVKGSINKRDGSQGKYNAFV